VKQFNKVNIKYVNIKNTDVLDGKYGFFLNFVHDLQNVN